MQFDLVCYVAFDRKPQTRRERAETVKWVMAHLWRMMKG